MPIVIKFTVGGIFVWLANPIIFCIDSFTSCNEAKAIMIDNTIIANGSRLFLPEMKNWRVSTLVTCSLPLWYLQPLLIFSDRFMINKKQFTTTKNPKNQHHMLCIRQGRIQGGAHPARAPLKLEKIWFVGVKSWFFHTKYPKNFRASLAIGKNKIFWRKIVIFHTKYLQNFRASLRSTQFFLSAPPLTWYPWSAPASGTVFINHSNHWTGRILYHLVLDLL